MAELYSWASPEVVGRMTLPQVDMYLGETKQEQRRIMSKAEIDKFVAEVRKRKGLD